MCFSKLTPPVVVVGDDGCNFIEVAGLIVAAEQYDEHLIKNCRLLGQRLDVGAEIMLKISTIPSMELHSVESVMSDMLQHWLTKKGRDATAVALRAELKYCGFKAAAAVLTEMYIPDCGQHEGLQLVKKGAFARPPVGFAETSESIIIIDSPSPECVIGKILDTQNLDPVYICNESDITIDHSHILREEPRRPIKIITIAADPDRLATQICRVNDVRNVLLHRASKGHQVAVANENVARLTDGLKWDDLTADFQNEIKRRKIRFRYRKIFIGRIIKGMRAKEEHFASKFLHSEFLLELVNDTEPHVEEFELGPYVLYRFNLCYSVSILPLPIFTVLLFLSIINSWENYHRVHDYRWNELNTSRKMEILRMPVEIQGRRSNVSHLLSVTGSKAILTSAFNYYETNSSEPLSFLNFTWPPIPDDPIPRTLLLRKEVRPWIFQSNTSDILAIFTTQLGDLSNLVGDQPVVTSTNYLDHNLDTGVVTLDQMNNFQKIVRRHPKRSVHLFNFTNGTLFSKESVGSIHLIQQHLSPRQSGVTEETFLKERDSSGNTPVCIVSGPGMGTTTVTTRLATSLSDNFIFYATSSYLTYLKHLGVTVTKDLLPQILAMSFGKPDSSLTEYNLIISTVLHAEDPVIELILDGIDEVAEEDRGLISQLIEAASFYKSIRVWVTAKPDLQQQVEVWLSTVCYSIQPLNHTEMVNFLVNRWASGGDAKINRTRLEMFAKACVLKVNDWKSQSSTDKEYSGSILVGSLLAEVKQEEAHQFANVDNVVDPGAQPQVEATLPAQIFTKFIAHRLKTVSNREVYIANFISIAIHSKFPKWGQRLRVKTTVPDDDLISTGILVNSGGEHKFFHSSFSDYFLADFAVQVIQNEVDNSEKTAFVEILLATTNSSDFQHGDATYFLNNFLQTYNPLGSPTKVFSKASLSKFRAVLHAAIWNDFVHLTQFLLRSAAYDKYSAQVFDATILAAAAQHARLQLLKLTLNEYLKVGNLPVEALHQIEVHSGDNAEPTTLFHLALQRGDFEVVDYLLKTLKFKGPIRQMPPKFRNVLTAALTNSRDDSLEKVSQKMNIIKKLVHLNPNLLKEVGRELGTVHPKLLAEVVCLQHQAKMSSTFLLHAAAEQLTRIHFNKFITQVPNDVLAAQTRSHLKRTLLMSILQHFDPLYETLHKLNTTGADFNAVNSSGDSVLAISIMRHRNGETLGNLLDFGAKCSDINLQHWNCLYVAAAYGTPEAVKVLAQRGGVGVNDPNSEGNTPLHIASKVVDTRTKDSVQILIDFGGNVNATNKIGSSPVHLAAITCNMISLKILAKAGANLALRNGRSLTPEVVAENGIMDPSSNTYFRKNCRDFVDFCKKHSHPKQKRDKNNSV